MYDVDLKDDVDINVFFKIKSSDNRKILIIAVEGMYGTGSGGNINGNYLSAMVAAGALRWQFSYKDAIAFDFSKLKYEMSDSLASSLYTLQIIRKTSDFEKTIIVSEMNKEAILSLLKFSGLDSQFNVIDNIALL